MLTIHNLSPKMATCAAALLLLAGTTIPVYATGSCIGLSGCEREICEKHQDLEEAKTYHDIDKILGIQHSIAKIAEHCAYEKSESSQLTKNNEKKLELLEEYEDDLADALDDYHDDISDAEGKADKLARAKQKYDDKIEHVTSEYQTKLAELSIQSAD